MPAAIFVSVPQKYTFEFVELYKAGFSFEKGLTDAEMYDIM